jgi:hypothetical protein
VGKSFDYPHDKFAQFIATAHQVISTPSGGIIVRLDVTVSRCDRMTPGGTTGLDVA